MNSELSLSNKVRFTGTLVNYFVVCPTKCWLFAHQLGMEQNSDDVAMGKLIAQLSYNRQKKEIEIDQTIVIDWIDTYNKIVHEVKKSDSLEEAHIWQLKYYLYYLNQKGVKGYSGEIDYPKLHQKKEVFLTDEDIFQIEYILKQIEHLITQSNPPVARKIPACKKCSYFNFCWI
ncbi:MAG: CRISPR-associated protein Cas4 [Thermoflavifilum sp.]|nr:CRISPR-associated protein Cas4 [Thermoflavifilum sp.]